jgi:hypothetical protein
MDVTVILFLWFIRLLDERGESEEESGLRVVTFFRFVAHQVPHPVRPNAGRAGDVPGVMVPELIPNLDLFAHFAPFFLGAISVNRARNSDRFNHCGYGSPGNRNWTFLRGTAGPRASTVSGSPGVFP